MPEAADRELSNQDHWDSRYAGKRDDGLGEHEWFRSFEDLRPFLRKHLPASTVNPSILHLGCGTSYALMGANFGVQEVTRKLYELGYHDQCNVDFSPVAIASMKEMHQDLPGTRWVVGDVRHMPFHDASFDVAFDKGTLDAMLWGSLWDPNDEVRANVGAYVDEVARCLKPGGVWLYITFRQPHFLRPLLEREKVWTTVLENLGGEQGSFEYFGWLMRKPEQL